MSVEALKDLWTAYMFWLIIYEQRIGSDCLLYLYVIISSVISYHEC